MSQKLYFKNFFLRKSSKILGLVNNLQSRLCIIEICICEAILSNGCIIIINMNPMVTLGQEVVPTKFLWCWAHSIISPPFQSLGAHCLEWTPPIPQWWRMPIPKAVFSQIETVVIMSVLDKGRICLQCNAGWNRKIQNPLGVSGKNEMVANCRVHRLVERERGHWGEGCGVITTSISQSLAVSLTIPRDHEPCRYPTWWMRLIKTWKLSRVSGTTRWDSRSLFHNHWKGKA